MRIILCLTPLTPITHRRSHNLFIMMMTIIIIDTNVASTCRIANTLSTIYLFVIFIIKNHTHSTKYAAK